MIKSKSRHGYGKTVWTDVILDNGRSVTIAGTKEPEEFQPVGQGTILTDTGGTLKYNYGPLDSDGWFSVNIDTDRFDVFDVEDILSQIFHEGVSLRMFTMSGDPEVLATR